MPARFQGAGATLLLLAMAAVAAHAEPHPFVAKYPVWGPKTVFAGANAWFQLSPKYGFEIRCDPTNDTCASPAFVPNGGETGLLDSTGEPPGGLYGMYGLSAAPYALCDVTEAGTFKIRRKACDGEAEDITSTGTGVHTFVLDTWNGRHLFLDDPQGQGFPAGMSFVWMLQSVYGCSDANSLFRDVTTGKSFSYSTGFVLCLKMHVEEAVEPGTYSGSFRFCETAYGTNCGEFPMTVRVERVPGFHESLPTAFPPLPGIADWEYLMTDGTEARRGGRFWCKDPANPEMNLSTWEGEVWYYDGAKTYFNIAEYLGDPVWDNCARTISSFYRTLVEANDGWVAMWRVFPDGLALAAGHADSSEETARYKEALRKMLAANPFTNYGPLATPVREREIAWAANLTLVWWEHFGQKRPNYDQFIDTLAGFALMYTDPDEPIGYQTFMAGIVMEPLIEHWEQTRDPRVPYVVKRLLDHIWANYDQDTHTIMYNTGAPDGPYCGTKAVWFNADPGVNCRVHTGQVLHNLVSYAFAWYWSITGDDVYRLRGDELFESGNRACCFLGKEFAQNFRKSFDYVRWRTRPRDATAIKEPEPQTPDVSQPPAPETPGGIESAPELPGPVEPEPVWVEITELPKRPSKAAPRFSRTSP